MKILHILAALSAAAGVTACGDSNQGELENGEYSQSVEVVSIDFPGMDEAMLDQIKNQMQQQANTEMGENICINSFNDSLDWKDLSKGMAEGIGGECKETKNEGTATTVSLEMDCQVPGAGTGKITLEGKAGSDSFTADMVMKIPSPQNGEVATIAMQLSTQRVGECS